MLKLNTSPDNVGGVARVIAIPVSAFRKIRVGLLTRHTSLTLNSIDDCIEIECNRNEEVSDQQQTSDSGISYLHQFSGKIFSLDFEREDILRRLTNGGWLLLVTSCNNIMKLYGSTDVPLRFSYRSQFGKYKSTPQRIEYTFSSTQPRPAILIDSAPF